MRADRELQEMLARDGLPEGVSEALVSAINGIWLKWVFGLAKVDPAQVVRVREALLRLLELPGVHMQRAHHQQGLGRHRSEAQRSRPLERVHDGRTLLLDLPRDYFSSDVYGDILGELFERGCQLDLNYHHRLDAIEDPAVRRSTFEHVAEALLTAGRHEDLLDWLSHQENTNDTAELLSPLASQIVRARTDVAVLQNHTEFHTSI